MFVPEKNKLNRFKLVKLPKPRDMFARYGQFAPAGNSFTGEELAPPASRKVDTLADMDAYDRYMQEQESSRDSYQK